MSAASAANFRTAESFWFTDDGSKSLRLENRPRSGSYCAATDQMFNTPVVERVA